MEEKKQLTDDIIKNLQEIQTKEKELKKQRLLLQKKLPWYKLPTNIIGILAIIVTIFLSLYSILKSNDKLELTCIYADPKPLTNFSPSLQEKISVTYKGIPTSNIGSINIKLKNTGTKGLRKDDFVDGPIEFKIQSRNKFGINDSVKTIPFLLDIVTVENSKQRNDILKVLSTSRNANFSYMPSLINQGDIVEFDVYISDINNVKTLIEGNISNGKLLSERYSVQVETNLFRQIGKIIIDIFGTKWIAVLILILIIPLSLLKTIAAFSEGFEWDFFNIIFGFLFLSLDSIFIILLISVFIN